MSLILNIDCATPLASVCICKNGETIAYAENDTQKEHASFLHPAIKKLLDDAELTLAEIDAFAITHGPGSYTGLRVAMATAKGFCMAIQKPLITINTLQVIALATKKQVENNNINVGEVLFCPMIDARRMEVFTAIYNNNLEEILPPQASIVDENFIERQKNLKKFIFCGDGSHKAKSILKNGDDILDIKHSAKDLGKLSHIAFINNEFANIAYAEPLYIKDFYFIKPTPKV